MTSQQPVNTKNIAVPVTVFPPHDCLRLSYEYRRGIVSENDSRLCTHTQLHRHTWLMIRYARTHTQAASLALRLFGLFGSYSVCSSFFGLKTLNRENESRANHYAQCLALASPCLATCQAGQPSECTPARALAVPCAPPARLYFSSRYAGCPGAELCRGSSRCIWTTTSAA